MFLPFKHFSFFVFLAFALCACASNPHPKGKPLPLLTFEHIKPLGLSVDSVEIENLYKTSAHPADISQEYIMVPGTAVERYLKARFQPIGGQGKLKAVIEEASVFYFDSPSQNSLGRWLNVAGTEEYSLTLKLHLMHRDDPTYREQGKVITATRRVRISEHVSLADREQRQLEGLEAMLDDLDAAVTRTVLDDFSLGSVFPEMRGEQDQNGKDFQTPE